PAETASSFYSRLHPDLQRPAETAWDITDYYEETQGTPLELWNGNVKLASDRNIGRMKKLILKRLNPTTPSKEEGE
ncbi:hypothetical protein GBAR_LOCUS29036, partial [Geodia barretti]